MAEVNDPEEIVCNIKFESCYIPRTGKNIPYSELTPEQLELVNRKPVILGVRLVGSTSTTITGKIDNYLSDPEIHKMD